jgi:hypothetical protein
MRGDEVLSALLSKYLLYISIKRNASVGRFERCNPSIGGWERQGGFSPPRQGGTGLGDENTVMKNCSIL